TAIRSDRICRTAPSCALIVLALRQFSTARPSAITPMAKIATPTRTSYRANADFNLARCCIRLGGAIGVLECWSLGLFEIPLLHFSPTPFFRCRSPRCILGDLGLGRERRVSRRP